MSEVFVSAVHPTIGRLYWVYTSNADCNYPDHYSLTDWSELATRFPKGWRDHDFLHWLYKSHISKVLQPDNANCVPGTYKISTHGAGSPIVTGAGARVTSTVER